MTHKQDLSYLTRAVVKDGSRPALTWAAVKDAQGKPANVTADGFRAHIVWDVDNPLLAADERKLIRLEKSCDISENAIYPDIHYPVYPAESMVITVDAARLIQALKLAKPLRSLYGGIVLKTSPADRTIIVTAEREGSTVTTTVPAQFAGLRVQEREIAVNVDYLLAGLSHPRLQKGQVDIRLSEEPRSGVFIGRLYEFGFLVMTMKRAGED